MECPNYKSLPKDIWTHNVSVFLLDGDEKWADKRVSKDILNMRITCKFFYEAVSYHVSVVPNRYKTNIYSLFRKTQPGREDLSLQRPSLYSLHRINISSIFEDYPNLFSDMFLLSSRNDGITWKSFQPVSEENRCGYFDHQFTSLSEDIYKAISSPILRLILFPNMSNETSSIIENIFGGWSPEIPDYSWYSYLSPEKHVAKHLWWCRDKIKGILAKRTSLVKTIILDEKGYREYEKTDLLPWTDYRLLILQCILKELPVNMPNVESIHMTKPVPSLELFGEIPKLEDLIIYDLLNESYDDFAGMRRIFNAVKNPLLTVSVALRNGTREFNLITVSAKAWMDDFTRGVTHAGNQERFFRDTMNYHVRILMKKLSLISNYDKGRRFLLRSGILFSEFFFYSGSYKTTDSRVVVGNSEPFKINGIYDEYIPFLKFLISRGVDIRQIDSFHNTMFIEHFVISYLSDITNSLKLFPIDSFDELLSLKINVSYSDSQEYIIDSINEDLTRKLFCDESGERILLTSWNCYYILLHTALSARKWLVAELILILVKEWLTHEAFRSEPFSFLLREIKSVGDNEVSTLRERSLSAFNTVKGHIVGVSPESI